MNKKESMRWKTKESIRWAHSSATTARRHLVIAINEGPTGQALIDLCDANILIGKVLDALEKELNKC